MKWGNWSDNERLAEITKITGLGDFISFFAVLMMIHQVSGNVVLAAYAVPIKSLGIALGGLLFPWVMCRFSAKGLIIASQWLSFLLMLLLAWVGFHGVQPLVILSILLIQTFLKQIFEGARETYSKGLGAATEQRSLQAEILHGAFGAQTIGPVMSFFLVKNFPLQIPLIVDALSFLLAGAMALGLKPVEVKYERLSVFRPFRYLGSSPGLARIFLLRSVGYWIPVGIFNFLLFSVIKEHYGMDILHSAWIYALVGLGSYVSTTLLRESKARWLEPLRRIRDARLAAMALVVLAATRIAFIRMPELWMALVVIGIGGLGNGVNAVSTQSLRRQLTTKDQFPEVVGLELVVGRLVDWAVASLMLLAVSNHWLNFSSGMWISAAVLLVLAVLHLDPELEV